MGPSTSAVLFDLDGVLVDSEPAVIRAWSAWAARHGLDPAEVLGQIHGRRALDSVGALAPAGVDVAAEAAWLEQREEEDTEGVVAMAGARALLGDPGPWGRAVVTSGTHAIATARLRAAGLTPPAVFVTADDVQRGKPAPDPYRLGAQRLGAEPGRCVVVEDAPAGVAAGKAAGMTVLAVLTTHPAERLAEADAIFATLDALRAELPRFLGPRAPRAEPRVELLWWAGCPSHPQALAELRAALPGAGLAGVEVELREVADEPGARLEGFVGSPTVRIDGRDVVPPGPDEPLGLACRVYRRRDGRFSPTIDPEDLRDALRRAASRGATP